MIPRQPQREPVERVDARHLRAFDAGFADAARDQDATDDCDVCVAYRLGRVARGQGWVLTSGPRVQ